MKDGAHGQVPSARCRIIASNGASVTSFTAFAEQHYRGNQTNAGMHRTIYQPDLGSGRVLLFSSGSQSVGMSCSVTFRSRFTSTPSSVTFSESCAGSGWSGAIVAAALTRDGFAVYSYQTTAASATSRWYGSYTDIA